MRTYIFDLDGTIVTNGKVIHDVIANKISSLADKYTVIFASARPIRDMLPLIPENLRNCLMVGCNGGMAWEKNAFVFSHTFADEKAKRIVSFLKANKIPYVLDGNWKFSVSDISHDFHSYIRSLSENETSEEYIFDSGITKILVLDGCSREKINTFFHNENFNFNIHHHRNENIFDITPQVENKYLSLSKLGVSFEEAIVFGNDENDFAMLDNARLSVFVGAMSDYPKATFYCRTEYIPTILNEVSDTFDRGINKHYVNKQQIAIESIDDLIRLQKTTSSWVPCEPDILLKLQIAKISSWIGYSLYELYSIALERSVFHKKRGITSPKEDGGGKKSSSLYKMKESMIVALNKELLRIKNNLEFSSSLHNEVRYKRINERLNNSALIIEKILTMTNTLLSEINIQNDDSTEFVNIYHECFISPSLPVREYEGEISHSVTKKMRMMYSNYINLEVPTIECCCAILNDFEFDWSNTPFIHDLSRQIEDEVYHAIILREEYEKHGGGGPALNSHFRFWQMARGEDLPTRLYIHQKMGEWIGIDAAIMQVLTCNDSDVTEIYTSIVSDEINHTRLGTYWIDQYCDDYEKVKEKALNKRKQFDETDEGPVKFPVNEYVCELCEFKRDEIIQLLERESTFGRLNG